MEFSLKHITHSVLLKWNCYSLFDFFNGSQSLWSLVYGKQLWFSCALWMCPGGWGWLSSLIYLVCLALWPLVVLLSPALSHGAFSCSQVAAGSSSFPSFNLLLLIGSEFGVICKTRVASCQQSSKCTLDISFSADRNHIWFYCHFIPHSAQHLIIPLFNE